MRFTNGFTMIMCLFFDDAEREHDPFASTNKTVCSQKCERSIKAIHDENLRILLVHIALKPNPRTRLIAILILLLVHQLRRNAWFATDVLSPTDLPKVRGP